MLHDKIALALPIHPSQMNRVLSLVKPITCDTMDFDRIVVVMCTRSGIR